MSVVNAMLPRNILSFDFLEIYCYRSSFSIYNILSSV